MVMEQVHKVLLAVWEERPHCRPMILEQLKNGAPDALIEKLIEVAQEEASAENAVVALAGIAAERSKHQAEQSLQRDMARSLDMIRQQVEFISSLLMLIVQGSGYQFIPEGEAPPLSTDPQAPARPNPPGAYKLYKNSEKKS